MLPWHSHSQHSQTTWINLQGRVDTILHTEICHWWTLWIGLYIHILTEQVIDSLDTLHQRLILQNFLFTCKAQTLQEHHRIVLHFMIKLRVEITEQVTCLEVPYPPHVVGNLVQTLLLLRKTWFHSQFLPLRCIYIICFNFHNFSNVIFELSFTIFIFHLWPPLFEGQCRMLRSSTG